MNAQPHAVALGAAHAIALASFAGSVSAKRREGKGPHRTAPQGNHSFRSPSIHSFSYVTRATATSDQRAGLGLGIVWMDELSANDDEPDCIVCCMDDDAALCGRDLSEEEWAADDDDNVCAECYRIFNILESADGVECPGCWRALFEEPSK